MYKRQGILGTLVRASPYLSRDLLKLAYTAFIRSRLEYCSAVFASASQSQLHKLDIIQKIAARVIFGAKRNAHYAPLVEALGLGSLDKRRMDHLVSLIKSIVTENCHPAILNMFTLLPDGKVINDQRSRISIGNRRFSAFGLRKYNCSMT